MSFILFILGCILSFLIFFAIGSALGGIFSPIAMAIDAILELIPIPVFLSRLALAFGTSWLVYSLTDSLFWLAICIGWWLLCFVWASGGADID